MPYTSLTSTRDCYTLFEAWQGRSQAQRPVDPDLQIDHSTAYNKLCIVGVS